MPPARDPRGEHRGAFWDSVHAGRDRWDVSWYEEVPATSVALVCSDGVPRTVVDVGAGAATLPDALLEEGVQQVALLDLSMTALALTASRLEERANRVTTIVGDVLTHRFDEQYDVWHDRAVFHFLTEPEQRTTYAAQARGAVRPGGLVVIGAYAADGPDTCSGLPVVRYDAASLATELGEGFGLVESRRVEHHAPSGSVEPFTWVVLRRG